MAITIILRNPSGWTANFSRQFNGGEVQPAYSKVIINEMNPRFLHHLSTDDHTVIFITEQFLAEVW